MKFIYNIGIRSYALGVRFASFIGNKKAKKWIVGRKDWRKRMTSALERFTENKIMWIHATSLGEFEQAKPLIEKIKADNALSEFKIVITFFSPSGFEYSKNYELADAIFTYHPTLKKMHQISSTY